MQAQQVELKGWKGKDRIIIEEDLPESYIVTEHRKKKYSREVVTIKHNIKSKYVFNLWQMLKNSYLKREQVRARDLWAKIINFYRLDVDIDAFNGGKNRAKYYFPMYYFPIKILESKGYILYNGTGGVRRLR